MPARSTRDASLVTEAQADMVSILGRGPGASLLPEPEEEGATHCERCGDALLSEKERHLQRCTSCEAKARARWEAATRHQADAVLTRSCPSLTAEFRAELLDAGLRPWDAAKVNALIREWGEEPNNRMTAAEREAELRARVLALLGAS